MWRTLPAVYELGERADGVLDRRLRVDAVLVVQVDVVGAEPLAASSSTVAADVLRAAVDVPRVAAGVGNQAEFRREDDVVPAAFDRATDQFLVHEGAVDLGGVDERHFEVESPVDRADRFVVVRSRPGVTVQDIPMAPRPMRETSSPPSEMCFIRNSSGGRGAVFGSASRQPEMLGV